MQCTLDIKNHANICRCLCDFVHKVWMEIFKWIDDEEFHETCFDPPSSTHVALYEVLPALSGSLSWFCPL